MSMSQEEIESLMNGLDLGENESSEETNTVDDVMKEIETSPTNNVESPAVEPAISEELEVDDILSQIEEAPASNDDLDELLAGMDTPSEETTNDNAPVSNDDIDALLNGMDIEQSVTSDDVTNIVASADENIEKSVLSEEPSFDEENFDDILAGIDGISNDTSFSEPEKVSEKSTSSEDEIGEKIKDGVFPLPAEKDTKVVNQLSQVANDSEEKASKIFDVLSFVLDDNNDIQKSVKNLEVFMEKQTALLESMNAKFPNISVFSEHLEIAKTTQSEIATINGKIDAENMQIFEAMELMQFHDINRQKIERVMAVIRKLSAYLNNLFEDEGSHKEVAVAKHIHGDNTADLAGDDLESLIAEFGN